MTDSVKYLLPEVRIPRAWYNIAADLPEPLPAVLHPGTGQPIGARRSCRDLSDPADPAGDIEIPEPVREVYKLWRPAPLHRALALHTPARIFYKHEGVSPAGSHKPNRR